jgi:hypothetical protein
MVEGTLAVPAKALARAFAQNLMFNSSVASLQTLHLSKQPTLTVVIVH